MRILLFVAAIVLGGCGGRPPATAQCPVHDVVSVNFPTGEHDQMTCPIDDAYDTPSAADLERALTLLWDQREGNHGLPRPVFDFVPSCTDDAFQLDDSGHATIAWRGSLACSHGFVRAIYEWNNIARWGMTVAASDDDETRLGGRDEELMNGILIANRI